MAKAKPADTTADAQVEAAQLNDRLTMAQSENPDADRVAVEHIGDLTVIRVDA